MRRVGILGVAMACCAAGHTRIAAAVDEIYADGFDGPKWFLDADGDGYGNPGVFVHSGTQPLGYVANGLDCDDANASVHPGAPDDPDAAFVDSNCDGIDGDIAKAVFVATAGVDGPACGSMVSPCATPQYAIGRLDAQHTQVYLQVGTYTGALTVGANAEFYGGYDVQWHRAAVSAGGPNAKLQGTSAAMGSLGSQAFAIYVAPSVDALFADVEVDAPDTVATVNGNGLDSYAVYADQNATLQLLRSRIVQGKGADGAAGFAGTDAVQVTIPAPSAGGDAMQYSTACDDTSHGIGGSPSFNACSSGASSTAAGTGGDGGTMDTQCSCCSFDFTARPGNAGKDSPTASGGAGKGGSGGSGDTTCGASQPGTAGVVNDGSGGIAGIGSSLVGGLWVADHGGIGTLGDNGGGGGGGGGSGGCDNGTDSYGAGGGGGGAGGCAALAPGTGGGGGGASFGVFAFGASSIAATANTFVLGTGGNGGDGGRAGIGQPGGKGGAGGARASNGSAPGNGGDGGRGGVAGGGGGGQGGSVFGIYSYASTITQSGNAFSGGAAGSAGTGGPSSLNSGAGQDGTAGTVSDVGNCVVATSCN